ncbi:MAG: proline--tRNA ligase [Nitrososphaerales archaeon]
MTKLFGRTLREAPADAEGAGYKVLQRAGYVRALAGSRYVYLPLGERSLSQLALALAEPWYGRNAAHVEIPQLGANGDARTLAQNLAASDIQSYRQLPVAALGRGHWQHQRSQGRGGPLNASEAPALIALTMDATEEAAEAAYAERQQALLDLCRRCGLSIVAVRDSTATGQSHSYLYLSDDGLETALLCDACGYASLAGTASSSRPSAEPEPALPLEKVPTPHTSTITDLARLLGVPESRTAKAVFLMVMTEEGERFVFAVVRGDTDVSETKLKAALRSLGMRVGSLRPASDADILAMGATPGYASPIGLKNVLVVVDRLAAQSPNLVAGANEEGYHLLNTNLGRDYRASLVTDIAAAQAGDGCSVCSGTLRAAKAALIGQSERVATEKGGPTYLDATGRAQPVLSSVHQVDLGALLTAIAGEHRDEQGLALPPAAAPFVVHLVSMPGAEAEVETLYQALSAAAISCLWDDRGDSAGVKFTDADLIGLPLRITLGKRSLQAGGAEFKRRLAGAAGGDKWIVPLDAAVEAVRQTLDQVEADVVAGARELPYGEHLR